MRLTRAFISGFVAGAIVHSALITICVVSGNVPGGPHGARNAFGAFVGLLDMAPMIMMGELFDVTQFRFWPLLYVGGGLFWALVVATAFWLIALMVPAGEAEPS